MAACSASASGCAAVGVNYEKLTSLDDIKVALGRLSDQESSIQKDLSALLVQQSSLETRLTMLHKITPNLDLISNDSKQLSGMIAFTSQLADDVSSKVRQLDSAKNRVISCMERVEDVLDLKLCTDGVQSAMQEENYEQAAAHIHRFLSLDENLLRITADASDGSTLSASFRLLREAESRLKGIVQSKFQAAVHAGDHASVERFFKIFPLLGQHDDGLTKFSKYLCSQLADTAQKNLQTALASGPDDKRASVQYADTLTLLFEAVARVIEIHQPLVETYYGPGRMLTFVVLLQKECDRQTRSVIDHFKKNREFEAKVKRVQQSLSPRAAASEKIDPKELDVLLGEITLIGSRTELYLRFIKRRVMGDLEVVDMNSELKQEKLTEVDNLLKRSDLSKLVQELVGSYILMEEYFIREMVQKAVSLDVSDESTMTSSMVDDAFFIVKKCVRRAMTSSSVDGVCAMINHSCSILEKDFREVLASRLRQGYPAGFDLAQAYSMVQSSLQQGKLQSSDTERLRTQFLVFLNNAEISCGNIQTLKKALEDEIPTLLATESDHAKEKLDSCLSDLGAISTRFKEVLDLGFMQLNNSVIKPRIKPLVEAFCSTAHNIGEEEFTYYEANDPWVQAFVVDLDTLLAQFKKLLTPSNYETFVSNVTAEVTVQLEKATLKSAFSRLGGLQFDKELRSLVGYLSSVTTWSVRDKFSRLTQMVTLLNLDKVSEILDYWGANSGPFTWRLTPSEVRQVLALRVDFSRDDINKLKL